MLEALITSKTRIKLLVKFFLNPNTQSYLRELASDFGESTNGIRVELNKMSEAGLLEVVEGKGNRVLYKAKTQHPLYKEIRKIVAKYTGIDDLLKNVLQSIGELKKAYLVGDYAKGIDSGEIKVILIGRIKQKYLAVLIEKLEEEIKRRVVCQVFLNVEEAKIEQYPNKMIIYKN